MGGEAQLDQSNSSVVSRPSLPKSMPSRPENIGFIGVWRTSKLLGLPMVLPEVDSGGVEGKYEPSLTSVSSMIEGLLLLGCGDPAGVMMEGPLL